MNCLNNFIGVQTPCSTASRSGLYIGDLPGFSVKNLSQVIDGKVLTAQQLIDAKMNMVGAQMMEKLGS